MNAVNAVIEAVRKPASDADVNQLAQLLLDAVDSNAGVSFVRPLSLETAREFWRGTIDRADPRAVFLVARDAQGIAGTVQLQPAWAPNQPHRADIAKLIVHRRARRRGIGRALMAAIEDRAQAAGFTLLTLDTVVGDPAERLYASTGWHRVGAIPNYALYPDGTPHAAVIFYKNI